MKYLLVIAVLLSFTVPVKALNLVGATDCGTWLEERKERSYAREGWLNGFLSGMVWYSEKEFYNSGNGITADQVYYWMDKYCWENPLNDIVDGAWKLFNERTGN